LININVLLALLISLIASSSIAFELLDKAMINAGKFESRGMPDYISMDANIKFIDFKRPQVGPKEITTILIKGQYIFYKDKVENKEAVISVKIDWGDASTDVVTINGSDTAHNHKYSSVGTYKLKIQVTTSQNTYFEYARAVVNIDPNNIATSGRVQPQKVLWREDCTGTTIDGKCFEIITTYSYVPTIEIDLISKPGKVYESADNLNITRRGSGTYWSPDNCTATSASLTGGKIYVYYEGAQGCVSKVTYVGICLSPYYYAYGTANCRLATTTKNLLEDGNVPASMYIPNNMGFE